MGALVTRLCRDACLQLTCELELGFLRERVFTYNCPIIWLKRCAAWRHNCGPRVRDTRTEVRLGNNFAFLM